MWVVELGFLEVFKFLYEYGVCLDILDVDGNSLVFWVMNKEYVNVIEYFFVNIKEEDILYKYCVGRSMLFVVIEYGLVEDVKCFVFLDFNVCDDDGLMLFMFVVLYFCNVVFNVVVLFEVGVNFFLEDDEGCIVIYYVC